MCRFYGWPLETVRDMSNRTIDEAIRYANQITALERGWDLRVARIAAGRMFDEDVVRQDLRYLQEMSLGVWRDRPVDYEANWRRFRERWSRGLY